MGSDHHALECFISRLVQQFGVGLQFPTNDVFQPRKDILPDVFARTVDPVTKPNDCWMVFPGMVSTLDM